MLKSHDLSIKRVKHLHLLLGQLKQSWLLKLKSRLLTNPILAFPSIKYPLILYNDARLTAMGAILAQVQNGQERTNCYASKEFSKAQTKYAATKRELLAIVKFTGHFRHYLLGRKFTIITDHKAVQWLHNFKDPDGLTARWLQKLPAFDYEVHHRPVKSIEHADGLSRIPAAKIQTSTRTRNEHPSPRDRNVTGKYRANKPTALLEIHLEPHSKFWTKSSACQPRAIMLISENSSITKNLATFSFLLILLPIVFLQI